VAGSSLIMTWRWMWVSGSAGRSPNTCIGIRRHPSGTPTTTHPIATGTTDPQPGTSGRRGGSGGGSLPVVATELVRRLDYAVLAMRYPVTDDFAIGLAGSFYNLVSDKGQPVARVLELTLPRRVGDPPTLSAPALSVATPPANRNSFARLHPKRRWP
jgi:hypothetical protein